MKRLNKKGFTLVELIAVVVLLSIITAIGVNSMNDVIIKSKEENYDLLIENIKNAVETYYHECKYNVTDLNRGFCGSGDPYVSPKYELTLGELVVGGFITGNGIGTNDLKLFDPMDNGDISCCKIKYSYDSSTGEFTIIADGTQGTCENPGVCPSSY